MKNIRKVSAFILLLFLSFQLFYQIFRSKTDEGDTWKIFYEQENNSIDVLAIGSSHLFGSINPAILYHDYGIASYVLGEPGMSIKVAYYTCVEALKTQSPKVVIIDITQAVQDEAAIGESSAFLWIRGMKVSWNKYNMAKAISEKNWLSLFLEYPYIHNRYDGDLEKRDFLPYRGDKYHKYYKGNRVFWHTMEDFPENDYPYIEDVGEISDVTMKYLNLLLELADKTGFDIIFYASPFAQTEDIQKSVNAIGQYVKEQDAEFINLNAVRNEIGLDVHTDMCDTEHVNHLGQEKTTAYLGSLLSLHYGIEDKRQDTAYESWELCAEDYYSIYNDYMLANGFEEIHSYISELTSGDYTILIHVQGEDIRNALKEDNILSAFSIEYSDDQDRILEVKNGVSSLNIYEMKYFDLGNHTVRIEDWSVMYDRTSIGFAGNAISFVVFDNKQESILEVRYYGYDGNQWNLISQDPWRDIWDKR